MQLLDFKPQAAPYGGAHAKAMPQAKVHWIRAESIIICTVHAHESIGTSIEMDWSLAKKQVAVFYVF